MKPAAAHRIPWGDPPPESESAFWARVLNHVGEDTQVEAVARRPWYWLNNRASPNRPFATAKVIPFPRANTAASHT